MEGPTLKQVLKSDKHEDLVEYFVFPHEEIVKDKEETLFVLNAAAQKIIGDYLWQNEGFVLKVGSKSLLKQDEDEDEDDAGELGKATEAKGNGETACGETEEMIPYYYGVTRFGDNVEDEWFVVHVLMELTKAFPGLVARVVDNDGEFLLIEAADYLPSWAESDEFCKRRVYLYDGKVHLIPKAEESSASSVSLPVGTPTVAQAVIAVRSHSNVTVANESIQKAIVNRIGTYPEKMIQSFHNVNLMLPTLLAAILKERPSLVPHAVQAFYHRDPIDLKAARLMKNFKPGDGLVKTRVRFTRCLYSMISKQDFRPDTKCGWTFPRPTSYEFKANSLGAKLTTGFEILMSRLNRDGSTVGNGNSSPNTDSSSPGWLRYVGALKSTGYFREYLEGSKPYQQLLAEAKRFYDSNLSSGLQNTGDSEGVIRDLESLVHTTKVDGEKLKEESASLPSDDDDSWMDIKPEDLESLLEAKFQSGGLNPEEIPTKLKEFMKQISDFAGVETGVGSGSNSGSGSPRSKPNGTSGSSHGEDFDEPFDFKADDFVSAIDKLLHDLGGLGDGSNTKEWAASDDDYGSDEDDFDVNLEEIKKMHDFSKDSKIHELMNQMDSELATTEVGKTFAPDNGHPETTSSSAKASGSGGAGASSRTTPATSKPKGPKAAATASVDELDEYDEEEGLTPVNIDMNALANILESFQSQDGPSGPSANLLRSVGLDLSRMKRK